MDMTNHKRELEVLGWCFDLLRAGQFNGAWAEKLYPAQMYLRSLQANLKAEIERLEHMAPVTEKPVESQASTPVEQSTSCAEPVAPGTH